MESIEGLLCHVHVDVALERLVYGVADTHTSFFIQKYVTSHVQ
jgi:hypothetical protein